MGHEEALRDAWAAGIIDGEGCITIKRRGGKYHSLYVVVGQSGRERPAMLVRLQEVYGGSIDNPKLSEGRLPQWQWTVAHITAERFLLRIQPYLVQKTEQARIALEFRRDAIGRGKAHLGATYYNLMKLTKNYHWKNASLSAVSVPAAAAERGSF